MHGVMDQRGGKTMYNDKNRTKDYDGITEPEIPRHLLSLFEEKFEKDREWFEQIEEGLK